MRILYDALSTLADAQRGRLAPHLPIFMPPLYQRWSLLADSDRDLLPLLECLASLCQALGDFCLQVGFLNWHVLIFVAVLYQRWSLLADSDRDLLPLLEFLATCARLWVSSLLVLCQQ